MQLIKVNHSTHKRYYISKYQNIPIKFPFKNGVLDIETQNIIVDKIEQEFTNIDDTIETFIDIRRKINGYKKSFLVNAYLGKLYEHKVDWKKIGDYVDLFSGHAFKKSEYTKTGLRLFQIANVTFGETMWEKIAYLPENYDQKHPELLLKEGDILMALNRPLLNHVLKIAILNKSDVPSILYQRVGRFDFNDDKTIDKKYFFYYLQSPIFVQELEKTLQGVNIPFINKSKLLNFKFPYVNYEVQERISQDIESKFSVLDKFNETINLSLMKTSTLKKSILKSAFEGKLVKTDG
jgi:restriction endonuclease S subunit